MFIDPDGMLSQSFIDEVWGSPSGTTWTNTGDGFTNNWGGTMDYSGSSMNYKSYSSLINNMSTGDGGGGVAGEIRLPTLYLESNNAWAAAVNIFLHHNAFMEKWNSSQAFAEKQRDWNFQMGNSSGRISMMGGAGDPFGIWEVAGMALAAKDKGNSNYILAALMITRSGNTGGLKVLNAAKGGMYIPKTPLAQHKVGGWDIPLPSPLAGSYPHTTLGGKIGSDGILYRQSATFTGGSWPLANGQIVPWSRVDWTTHGRPLVHPNPHQHVFNFNGKNWQYGKAVPFP